MDVVINGICGRMGSFLYDYLKQSNEVNVVCGVDLAQCDLDLPVYKSLDEALKHHELDVFVDFSSYPSSVKAILFAIENGLDIVSGTTGNKEDDCKIIKERAKAQNIGIKISPNFSSGTQMMIRFIEALRGKFNYCEIIEEHSIHKKDAPSGTAKYISRVVDQENMNVHSIRLPNILANHKVTFADDFQSISVSHTIASRKAFLKGIEEAIIVVYNNKEVNIQI